MKTEHHQVDCRGVMVDANIAPLLEILWDRGWSTTHSCEDNNGQVYISFAKEDDALAFLQEMRARLGFKDFYVHVGRYTLGMSTSQGAQVRFDRLSTRDDDGIDMLSKTIEVLKARKLVNDSC